MTQPTATAPTPSPDGPGVMLGLTLTLGRVQSAVEKIASTTDALAAQAAMLPNQITLSGAGTVLAGGVAFLISLGSPQQGRFWYVRRCTVSDAGSFRTVITGATAADWYVGNLPVARGAIVVPPQQLALPMVPPASALVSGEQIQVTSNDTLFVLVAGATSAGQIIQASASVLDYSEASYAAVISL